MLEPVISKSVLITNAHYSNTLATIRSIHKRKIPLTLTSIKLTAKRNCPASHTILYFGTLMQRIFLKYSQKCQIH